MPADPEPELLFRLVQRIGNSAAADPRIREVAAGDPDWRRIVSLAERHGLVPLLHETLAETGADVPPDAADAVRRRNRENALENLRYTRHLHELVAAFEENDVRAIPYKGPVVAQVAYGDVNRRTFGDLDFLVAEEDIARARDVLVENGYRQTNFVGVPVAELVERSTFRWEREFRFVNEADGVDVEIRPRFMGRERSRSARFADLWRRRTRVTVGGRALPALSPEDRALLLLTHGSKHGWCRLSWACDVAMLLDDVEWERVVDRATEYGWRTAALLGLAVTAELADAELPPGIRREIATNRRADWGSSVLTTLFRTDPTGERLDSEPWTVILFSNDTVEESLRELVDVVFSPRQSNHELVRLPPELYPLYYLLRPPEILYHKLGGAWELVDRN